MQDFVLLLLLLLLYYYILLLNYFLFIMFADMVGNSTQLLGEGEIREYIFFLP
jgi:hypothetical protein